MLQQITTNSIITKRAIREYATHYDISHSKRESLKGAWKFAKAINLPFNTLVSFEFESTGKHSDVNVVRDVCHRTRVFLRKIGLASAMLWSRFKRPGSDIEEVKILLHIDNVADYVRYVKNVQKWQPDATVQVVGYEKNMPYGNKGDHTVFDVMFRSLSSETRDKNPDLLYEPSSAIVGWNVFESKKLQLAKRIEHRNQSAIVSALSDQLTLN